jgi:hypothetical protein
MESDKVGLSGQALSIHAKQVADKTGGSEELGEFDAIKSFSSLGVHCVLHCFIPLDNAQFFELFISTCEFFI